jgi:hypothetical protein
VNSSLGVSWDVAIGLLGREESVFTSREAEIVQGMETSVAECWFNNFPHEGISHSRISILSSLETSQNPGSINTWTTQASHTDGIHDRRR